MARLVLADASPLIVLSRVGGLDWLPAFFGTVTLPEEVRQEVLDCGAWPGQASLRAALDSGWLLISARHYETPLLPDLDEGEAACIRAAVNHPEPGLILMDERPGRAIAREFGIQVAGTAALIGMARQRGLIPSARAIFEELLQSDFRISADVIRAVLERVGET